MKNKTDKLLKLYNKLSKHSNYQSFAESLHFLPSDHSINKSHFDKPRLNYILRHLDFYKQRIIDIGGNTGFFSFSLISYGAYSVHYYEGNKDHCEFVKLASKVLNLNRKIKISKKYYPFNSRLSFDSKKIKYDVALVLNVLHHLGDDFDYKGLDINSARKQMIKAIISLSNITKIVVLQIGFNWKGSIRYPLFPNGTKTEMIDFIKDGTKGFYDVISIGIPEIENEGIVYNELNNENKNRNNELGEFLNRPIFILKSILN